MSSPIIIPLVQTHLDPVKLANDPQKFEDALRASWKQLSTIVNNKARGVIVVTIRTVFAAPLPVVIFNSTVAPGSGGIQLISAYATATVAGAGGANGTTIRVNGGTAGIGGSANLDFNILPVAAASTSVPQATFNGYTIPAGNIFRLTVQADDHAGSPQDIELAFDCLYL